MQRCIDIFVDLWRELLTLFAVAVGDLHEPRTIRGERPGLLVVVVVDHHIDHRHDIALGDVQVECVREMAFNRSIQDPRVRFKTPFDATRIHIEQRRSLRHRCKLRGLLVGKMMNTRNGDLVHREQVRAAQDKESHRHHRHDDHHHNADDEPLARFLLLGLTAIRTHLRNAH